MVIFINGSFGVGKTTVARLLRARLPQSVIFDPEPLGIVAMCMAPLFGARVDDFQDLSLWREASKRAINLLRYVRRVVIVPMTFSNVSYLH